MQRTYKSIMVMDERNVKEEAKRIPYGMMNRRSKQEQNQACLSYALQEGGRATDRLSNFVAVREDNCYYVDKTRFIEKVEKANKYFSSSALAVSAKASPCRCYVIIMTSTLLTSSTDYTATCILASILHQTITRISSYISTLR